MQTHFLRLSNAPVPPLQRFAKTQNMLLQNLRIFAKHAFYLSNFADKPRILQLYLDFHLSRRKAFDASGKRVFDHKSAILVYVQHPRGMVPIIFDDLDVLADQK